MSDLNDDLEITEQSEIPENSEPENSENSENSEPENSDPAGREQNSSDENDENSEFSENDKSDEESELTDEIIGNFLSLNETKSFLRIIGDAENEIIKALIYSAKSFFESYTQRQLSEFNEIPAEIAQWARVKIATWYELRTSHIVGVSVSKADYSFIDCILDKYRKSPMRLTESNANKIKAHIKAQNELIARLASAVLEKTTADDIISKVGVSADFDEESETLLFTLPDIDIE